MTDQTTDTGEKPQYTKRIWLLLVREGGRWSQVDISQRLGAKNPAAIAGALSMMRVRGALKRFLVNGYRNRVEYGVSSGCKVPMDVTVQDLLDAGFKL